MAAIGAAIREGDAEVHLHGLRIGHDAGYGFAVTNPRRIRAYPI